MRRYLLVLGLTGLLASCSRSARPPPLPPLGKLVDVGGQRMNLRCEGDGQPVVVFDSGLGLDSGAWQAVEPLLDGVTRYCVYDRLGRGRSDPVKHPHGLPQMAAELHSLLSHAGERGPYVLVGHSMAGPTARWFHRAHPSDVAGLVFVDPASVMAFDAVLSDQGGLSQEQRQQFDQNVRRMEGLDRQLLGQGYRQLDAVPGPDMGKLPLIVLTAERESADFALRWAGQQQLVPLSKDSLHLKVNDSNHAVPQQRPDAIATATKAVVEAARTSKQLRSMEIGRANSL